MLLLLVTELDFDAMSQERVGSNWSCYSLTTPKILLKLERKVIVTLGECILKLLLIPGFFFIKYISLFILCVCEYHLTVLFQTFLKIKIMTKYVCH